MIVSQIRYLFAIAVLSKTGLKFYFKTTYINSKNGKLITSKKKKMHVYLHGHRKMVRLFIYVF